jgi:hypothetical protein
MPLLDHFHPPLRDRIPWTSIHSAWATHLANNLNERWLPDEFVATEYSLTAAHPEIDVATYHDPQPASPTRLTNGSVAVTAPRTYTVPRPDVTLQIHNRPAMDASVHIHDGSRTLVAVIEFISPSNLDRPSERRGFIGKVAAHVLSGVSVIVIDIVTHMRFNLHNEFVDLLEAPPVARLPDGVFTYAASYRPKVADEQWLADIWRQPVAVGQPLPTMPLRLTGDTFVPVEFEETYVETCRRRKLL